VREQLQIHTIKVERPIKVENQSALGVVRNHSVSPHRHHMPDLSSARNRFRHFENLIYPVS
jgi:hypothetical protein